MNRSPTKRFSTDDGQDSAKTSELLNGDRKAAIVETSGHRPAVKLTLLMAVLIFSFETLAMYMLHTLKIETPWIEAVVDSLFLLVMMTPPLYFLLFKPLVRNIHIQQEAEAHQSAYQRILKISNTSQNLEILLQRYADELKLLTQCEIVTIRVIDWLGHVKYHSSQTPECLHNQDSPKCMTDNLQSGFCIKVMQELEESLTEYQTEMGSLYCPELTRMLSNLPRERVQQIVSGCPLDRFETLVLVPMVENKVRLGFIQLADTRPNAVCPNVTGLIEKSSMQVAAAIQRLRAEDGLRQTKNWLESRVTERTAMLTEANDKLNQEIAEQKRLYDAIEGYKRKLQSLSKQVLEEEQQGRKLIATELHDRIGHNLALVKIKLGMMARQLDATESNGHLTQIREVIDQTISDTRTLTFELSPPILYEIGLKSALEWLVQQMEQDYDLRVQIVSQSDEGDLDEHQRFVLFRATRELLFNVIKHAKAEKALLIIRRDDDKLFIDIEDNGIGFKKSSFDASSNESKAFGLFGIRERLGYLGGKLSIANRKKGGARVTLQIPTNVASPPPIRSNAKKRPPVLSGDGRAS